MRPPQDTPKRGLTINEAAHYCGVSRNTLRRYGPTPIRIGGRVLYDRHMLDRWFDQFAGIGPSSSGGNAELRRAIDARRGALRHPAG